MNLAGRCVSCASGAGASKPLSARTENTIPARTPPNPCGALATFSGAAYEDPGPGLARKVSASANMMSSSIAPKMTVVRRDSRIPKWVRTHTTANVASAKIHHGMSTPEAV